MAAQHWHAGITPAGDQHTWPCGDTLEHEPHEYCPCNPSLTEFRPNAGAYGQDFSAYLHHAADGRPYIAPGTEVEEQDEDAAPPKKRHLILIDVPSAATVLVAIFGLGWVAGALPFGRRR